MSKRINSSRIAVVVSFLLFVSMVLIGAGSIVRAKFIGDSTTIVNGFYAEKKNDIDMLVIGSSNSFCTVDPIVLYEEYGIAAYDFGSSSQPLNISTLYLKEALKTQKPRIVAFEVNMIVGSSNEYEAGLRWGLTDIPLSADKLRCIYQSVGKVDAEYFSYVFPVFRYHNRWKEVSKLDYTYFSQDKTNYTKGYLETQSVTEAAVNLEGYGYDEGEALIEEGNIAFLDEMAALCSENNVELLLFKSPRENWYRYETEAVRKLAGERGLKFVDYNELYYNGELELDPVNDFRDGQHLNDFGARKVTSHLGAYVKANYELPDRRDEGNVPNSWDEALKYRQRNGWQEFMAAADARECLELLQADEDYILIVTDNQAENGSSVQQWVYQDGSVALEVRWRENGVRHMKVGGSELVMARLGDVCQVLIDDIDHYQADKRWNIIVYDKIIKDVKASLAFDE